MSNQSANMTLGITGACGRTAASPAAGSVRLLESSADDDSTGPEDSELAGRSAAARSWPVSLRFGLPVTTSAGSADFLAAASAPSTRFLRFMTVSSSSRENMPCFSPGLR
uniref:Uncharacterized protein n=1 Tax=Oryza meridionalis TaxID=40149 RepID=A0A0E0DGK3_9ORYZ